MTEAGLQFLLAASGGLAVGLILGVIVVRVHRIIRVVPVVSSTVSLLTPFASYLLADVVGASGVLAVVAAGMYVARAVPRILGPALRVQTTGLWMVVTFMLESLVFILVGLELPYVARALNTLPLSQLLWEGAIISVTIILVRIIWVVPSTYVFRTIGRWFRHSDEPLPPLRSVLFISWAGLRGADSLVLALALPLTTSTGAPFVARDQIIFIAFCVIFITLVLQGPTLAPLARRLNGGDNLEEAAEETHARLAAVEAGLKRLDGPDMESSDHPEVVRYLRERHRQRARRWASLEAESKEGDSDDVQHEHFTLAPIAQGRNRR